jgi:hypothetical protein
MVEPKPYNRRFTVIYFVLAAVVGAAVAIFVGISLTKNSSPSSSGSFAGAPAISGWSAWRPSSSGLPAIQEIANYVSAKYRRTAKDQLVVVQGNLPYVAEQLGATGTPTVTKAPISSIAVPVLQNGQLAYAVDNRTAIEYQMCGTGPGCTIPGAASNDRGLLLQREALELALYTFQYVAVDVVVTLYPPAPGEPPKYALYFTRADFEKQLSEPLADTLANKAALLPGGMPATDVRSVRALVQPRVFGYRYSLQLDGTAQIVLTQPGTTEATIAPTAGG